MNCNCIATNFFPESFLMVKYEKQLVSTKYDHKRSNVKDITTDRVGRIIFTIQ